jgi:hypothetical protein
VNVDARNVRLNRQTDAAGSRRAYFFSKTATKKKCISATLHTSRRGLAACLGGVPPGCRPPSPQARGPPSRAAQYQPRGACTPPRQSPSYACCCCAAVAFRPVPVTRQ